MDNLLDLAVRACETAIKAGAEFAQAHTGRNRSFSVSLEKGAIETSQQWESSWVSIRAWYRGGVGSASVNALDWGQVEETARAAAALARQSDPDPDFVTLPGPQPLPTVEGLYDERVVGLSASEPIRWALEAADEALAAVPEAIVSGGASFAVGESAIANSVGIAVSTPSTGVGCYIRAVVRRGDSVGMWFEESYGRVMDDFRPQGIGKVAAEGALEYLDARDIPSGDYPLVVGPLAAYPIYYSVAAQANAEDVQRNRSYLIGKRGQRIAAPALTVVDNALIPRGRSSVAYDSDGVPHRPVTIVQDGVLLTYLHNTYTANKAGEPNTGHAMGDGISPTNVNVRLGRRPAKDLIAEIDDGIYLAAGGPHADPTTGDFSSTVDFGFKIERGEIAYPIRNAAIGGSFLELLQDLDEISSDYREEPGLKMPTMRFRKVRLAGSG